MSVLHCTTSEALDKIIKKGDAIIDFSAEWCGPCKMIAPHFERLAKDNPSISFVHIDIDQARESMEKELSEIQAVPTFWIYKASKRIHKFAGGNLKMLEESVAKLKEETEKKETKEEAKEEKKEEKKVEAKEKKEEKKESKPKEEKVSEAEKESEKKPETAANVKSDHAVESKESKAKVESGPKEEKKVEAAKPEKISAESTA